MKKIINTGILGIVLFISSFATTALAEHVISSGKGITLVVGDAHHHICDMVKPTDPVHCTEIQYGNDKIMTTSSIWEEYEGHWDGTSCRQPFRLLDRTVIPYGEKDTPDFATVAAEITQLQFWPKGATCGIIKVSTGGKSIMDQFQLIVGSDGIYRSNPYKSFTIID